MAKININTDEFLRDMQCGMDDDALMSKYRLSPKLFDTLCIRLIETGRLKSSQLSELKLLWAQKKGKIWRCPACHMPQYHPFDECPQCGIIVSKFEKKLSREKESSKPEGSLDISSVESEGQISSYEENPTEKRLLTRQCSSCGLKLSPEAKFCTRCGTRIASES